MTAAGRTDTGEPQQRHPHLRLFYRQNEAEETNAGAGDAPRLCKGSTVALKNQGRIFPVFRQIFWGGGVGGAMLETNEDKSALEILHTGH